MALFRFHRGTLLEAMATVITVRSKDSLIDVLNEREVDLFGKHANKVSEIRQEYQGFDDRINWDTYIISVKHEQPTKPEFYPVGYTNQILL